MSAEDWDFFPWNRPVSMEVPYTVHPAKHLLDSQLSEEKYESCYTTVGGMMLL